MVVDYFIRGTDIDTTSGSLATTGPMWILISIVHLIYLFIYLVGREEPKHLLPWLILILPAYKYKRLTVLFILGKSLPAYLLLCTYFVPIILDKLLLQPFCAPD